MLLRLPLPWLLLSFSPSALSLSSLSWPSSPVWLPLSPLLVLLLLLSLSLLLLHFRRASIHGPTMITDNVQIRLHLFPQSIHGPTMITCALALVGFERSVKAEFFWLASLSSQNSPSEPKCRKLQYFGVWGMRQNAGRQVSHLPCF